MKKVIFLLFSLFLVFLIYGIAWADILYLKNGKQVSGKSVTEDTEKVVFRVGEADDTIDVTFFTEEVLRIDKKEVSNVIELPFAQGKGIKFPRPVLSNVPFLANQTIDESEEQSDETKFEDIPTQQEAQNNGQAPIPTENFISDKDREILSKQKNTIEELLPLLSKEESDYFKYINSAAEISVNNMMSLLTNPQAFAADGSKMVESIRELSADTNGIIGKLTNLKPPEIFVNFHKKYISNLTLVQEVFEDISKGNILNSQTKIIQMQDKKVELQQELEKILEEKKKNQ
mgnify:CR=1 FL=1